MKTEYLRGDQRRLLHFLTEADGLRGRLVPPGRRSRTLRLLRPTAEQGRHGPMLLPAAWRARRGRRARARLAGSWPMARGDFSLGVVLRPVGECSRRPEVACCPSSSLGVVFQSRRPQIGVVDVALRPVGEELAGRPRGAGWWVKEGILTKADWSKQNSARRRQSKERKERRLTTGGGLAREYGSLPNR